MADDGRVTIKAILDSSGISRGVKDIDRALGSIKTSGLDGVGRAAERSGESLEGVGRSAESGMGEAADAAEAAASTISGSTQDAADTASAAVSGIGDAGASLGGLADAIADPVEEGAGKAEGSVGRLKGFFGDFVEETKASFEGLLPVITGGNLAAMVVDTAKQAVQAVIDIGKRSFEAYASYEQLVGGVETLFGTGGRSLEEYAAQSGRTVDQAKGDYDRLMGAQAEVMRNAEQAYRTAGMSQNAYMETVTSFSASLIKGLGGDTVAAARYADMAIVDMSDNANKMGTSMQSIQDAYQGFAKQNYTMLDNLKLGYGGTQSEMAKLINDSGVLGDAMTVTAETVNDVSFDKIVEAIHVIQERMDIAGTTSKEAATTIEGSMGMVGAAWENLLIGFGDPEADMDALMDALLDSVVTAASNVVPAVGRVAASIVTAIPQAFASVGTKVWDGIVGSIDAATGGAASRVIAAVGGALQEAVGPVADFFSPVVDRVSELANALVVGIQSTFEVTGDILGEALPPIEAVGEAFERVFGHLMDVLGPVGSLVGCALQDMRDAVLEWLPEWDDVMDVFFDLRDAVELAVQGVGSALGALWETVGPMLEGFLDTVGSSVWALWEGAQPVVGAFLEAMAALGEALAPVGQALMDGLGAAFTAVGDAIGVFWEMASPILEAMLGFFWELAGEQVEAAVAFITETVFPTLQGVFEWIRDNAGPIVEGLFGAVQAFIEWLQPALDAVNAFLTGVVLPIAQGVCTGIAEGWRALSATIGPILDGIRGVVEGVWNTISGIVNVVVGGIKGLVTGDFSQMQEGVSGVMDGISGVVEGVWNTVKGVFEGTLGAIGAVVDSTFGAIGDVIGGAMDGAESVVSGAVDAILGFFDFDWHLPELKLPHIVVGEYIDVPVLGRIPNPTTLRVDWYATGGVFDTASVIGVGEAGPEAVVPLRGHRMRPFAEAVAGEMGAGAGDVTVTVNLTVERMEGTEGDVARLADMVDREVRRKLDRRMRMGAYA